MFLHWKVTCPRVAHMLWSDCSYTTHPFSSLYPIHGDAGVIPDQFINAEKFMPTVNLPIILRCIPLDQGRELGYKQIEPMQGCGEYVTSTPLDLNPGSFWCCRCANHPTIMIRLWFKKKNLHEFIGTMISFQDCSLIIFNKVIRSGTSKFCRLKSKSSTKPKGNESDHNS